jgi:hypothetical protein
MTATPETASSPAIRSLIPARIDRLPWSRLQSLEDIATPLSVAAPSHYPI